MFYVLYILREKGKREWCNKYDKLIYDRKFRII